MLHKYHLKYVEIRIVVVVVRMCRNYILSFQADITDEMGGENVNALNVKFTICRIEPNYAILFYSYLFCDKFAMK